MQTQTWPHRVGNEKKRKRVAILLVTGIFTAVGRTKITPCFLRLLSAIFDSSMFAPRDLTLSSITWFSVARAVLLPYIVFAPILWWPLFALHSHPSGYSTWVLRTRVTATNSGSRSVISGSSQSGFILHHSLSICDSHLHSPHSHPVKVHPYSIPTLVYHLSLLFFASFAGGGNRSTRRKPLMCGPSQNFLFRCDIMHVSLTGKEARTAACHHNIGHLSSVLTRQPRTPQTTHLTLKE
jgi:hypothetical protein